MASFGNLSTSVEPLAGLMREHDVVHSLAERTAGSLKDALDGPDEADSAVAAAGALRDLEAYLIEDLVLHIAKEEEVLFPALRGFAAALDQVLDEMVEQHDEIRARAAAVESAIARLDWEHAEVESATAGFRAGLASQPEPPTRDWLASMLDAVNRLDWIFQGHFGDEEDDLFVPALDLLPTETWRELASRAAEIDG